MVRLPLVLLIVLLAATPAGAAFSGLTLIPTADVLAGGQVCLDYQVDGPFPLASGVDAALLNTQCGIGTHLEAGMDLDFSAEAPAGALFNGKVLVPTERMGFALALGSHNIGEGLKATTYVVATKELRALRLHAGAQRSSEATDGFGGVDYALSDRLQLWAERLAGDENASAVTLAYQLTERWGISLAWQHPNSREADDSYSLHVGCALPSHSAGE